MRILINTVCFYPNVGGLETINMILATEFAKLGHDVVLIAPNYPNESYNDRDFQFRVIRTPSKIELFKEYLKCDVFLHSPISLKAIWPVVLYPFKKWYCSYHQCKFCSGTNLTLKARIKYIVSRFTRNIAVSNAVAQHLNLPKVTVIHNAYNDKLFIDGKQKTRRGFVFVGRLVSEKGVFVLLDAFKEYVKRNSNNEHTYLNIIGDGEERANIEAFIKEHDLDAYVKLSGTLVNQALVNSMNQSFCQIVPSICNEAFGIVALEAMATGCIPLVSDGDGLQEAVGDMGYTFKKGNSNSLLERMELITSLSSTEIERHKYNMKKWCLNFTSEVVAKKYINCFEDI